MDVTITSAAAYNEMAMQESWHSICDVTVGFAHPDLRRLLGTWRRSMKASAPPRKSDMTERTLRSFRSDVAVYERVVHERGERRWRVERMGPALAQIMGDLTGKFLDEAIEPLLLPRWYAALDATLAEGMPLRFLARNTRMNFLNSEYFCAPLIGMDGSASFVLAAGRFSGARRWQDIEAEAKDRLGL